jgi:hypothetical protein
LLTIQEKNRPITLNSILSAIILNQESEKISVSSLIKSAGTIYEYIRDKTQAFTYMKARPHASIIEKNLLGLGFKIENMTKKNATVLIGNLKQDMRKNLILSHYTMHQLSVFIPEGCIAVYLRNLYEQNNLKPLETPIDLESCMDACKMLSDLLSREKLRDYDFGM